MGCDNVTECKVYVDWIILKQMIKPVHYGSMLRDVK